MGGDHPLKNFLEFSQGSEVSLKKSASFFI